MANKYKGPAPRMADVLKALPAVPQPLVWRLCVRPLPGSALQAHACVELVHVHRDASERVWRRWGRSFAAGAEAGCVPPLLVAVQDAHAYLEGLDLKELARRITWDLGLPS